MKRTIASCPKLAAATAGALRDLLREFKTEIAKLPEQPATKATNAKK